MDGNFVTFAVHFLHGGVIGVFMRDKECRLNVATVRVFAFPVEYFFVQLDVVVVDRVVESDGYHLRHVLSGEVAWDGGAVFRAETVGEDADGGIAWRCPVRIVVDVYKGRTFRVRNVARDIRSLRLTAAPTFLRWKVGRHALGAAPAF